MVAYVLDASEAEGFLLEDVPGGEASPEVFSRHLALNSQNVSIEWFRTSTSTQNRLLIVYYY